MQSVLPAQPGQLRNENRWLITFASTVFVSFTVCAYISEVYYVKRIGGCSLRSFAEIGLVYQMRYGALTGHDYDRMRGPADA
jgi:hypothetical protein